MNRSFLDHVLCVVDCEFGRRVSDHIGIASHRRVDRRRFPDASLAGTTAVVAIHADDGARLREDVDRICAAHGLPSVGLRLSPTSLECGPAVVPGRSACARCWRRRVDQHSSLPAAARAAAVDGLAEGFAPHHVVLAAAFLRAALDEVLGDGPPGLGGTVRTANLVSGAVAAHHTVATDRCDRCGDRFAAAWRTDLAGVFARPSTEGPHDAASS